MNTPVALVGESGTGKSSAMRTLPPERTLIVNTELKSLPFENYLDFKVNLAGTSKKINKIIDALSTPEGVEKYDYVVLDSFTSASEIFNLYAESVFRGYDQWKQYNAMIVQLVNKMKTLKQQVFFLAIPEQKDSAMGEYKWFIRVQGKALKYGWIEKEFAIVLYTVPQYDEESGEMDDVCLQFKSNRNNTAKSPLGMFEKGMGNDLLLVSNKIKAYYDNRAEAKTTGTTT